MTIEATAMVSIMATAARATTATAMTKTSTMPCTMTMVPSIPRPLPADVQGQHLAVPPPGPAPRPHPGWLSTTTWKSREWPALAIPKGLIPTRTMTMVITIYQCQILEASTSPSLPPTRSPRRPSVRRPRMLHQQKLFFPYQHISTFLACMSSRSWSMLS